MKKIKMIYNLLMVLPLIVTCICIPNLPGQIPAHFNAANEITRWGSKYEAFILPIFIIIFGILFRGIAILASKYEQAQNHNNERIVCICGAGSLAVFNAMTYYFLYVDFKLTPNLTQVNIDLQSLTFSIMGVLLIIMGNVMPKCKMNSLVGLRTIWSMKNEKAWAMSQRFGGISFIITGVLMTLGNALIFREIQSFVYTMILLCGDTILSVLYSYHAAKVSEQL